MLLDILKYDVVGDIAAGRAEMVDGLVIGVGESGQSRDLRPSRIVRSPDTGKVT